MRHPYSHMASVIYTINLGLTDYRQTLRLQYALHARCKVTGENMLVLTQHEPLVTLGYRRPREQLRLPEEELQRRGIPVVEVERGGGATYHGPGQLVAYPIFSSLLRHWGVRGFVAGLEEVMCHASRSFGVQASRRPGLPGAWVGERKLGAVGITIRGGASLHGCALNVNLDLLPFSYIVPCGLADVHVTSLQQECGADIAVAKVADQACRSFAAVFAVTIKEMPDEWCRIE